MSDPLRISVLLRHLEGTTDETSEPTNLLSLSLVNASSSLFTVRIGDVSLAVPRPPPALLQQVPALYLGGKEEQDVLRALRFMLQKDALGQDMYLIGPPGPLRRRITMKYAELTKRPVEYVALSQDTTESDLKQRREIAQGTAKYIDCAATRAAINGSILILDGIEKAERNVLVVLNNLLENREMALEDGRFLVSPKRFDALLKDHDAQELENWKLVRCSDQFRCVALGLPIPRYVGNPLDPPFRSRFQARDIQGSRLSDQLNMLVSLTDSNVPESFLRCLVQAAAVIREMREADGISISPTAGIPEFPQGFEFFVAEAYSIVPELSGSYISHYLLPQLQLLKGVPDDRLHMLQKVLRRFGLEEPHTEKGYGDGLGEPEDNIKQMLKNQQTCKSVSLSKVQLSKNHKQAVVEFLVAIDAPLDASGKNASSFTEVNEKKVIVKKVNAGGTNGENAGMEKSFVSTSSTNEALSRMVLAHCCDADFCLVGEKGGGKSRITAHFAHLFGYRTEHIPLYKDVSSRQLLQRRSTLSNGDTIWEDSALVRAALKGRLAVLDGIEQMVPGTLATLQDLITDRECCLPDGRKLLSQERFDAICKRDKLTPQQLNERGVEVIHPSFRVVALARPSNLSGTSAQQTRGAWLFPELQTMFRFVYLEPMPSKEQAELLMAIAPNVSKDDLEKLNQYADVLRRAILKDDTLSALESTVSLRQTARVCRRLSSESALDQRGDVLYKALLSAALDRFLPPLTRDTFHGLLKEVGIVPKQSNMLTNNNEQGEGEDWRIQVLPPDNKENGSIGTLKVGQTTRVDIFPPKDPLLVPSIVFYDNPRQTTIMADMMRDWTSGQHLLLIGNQGVGKNKLADRMLQLMQLPREYIQLHRDTTVQNLTSNPTIVEGRLMYEDSPLVRAAREGRILVVDEADKAPTYVTAVLKALVEDRSMLLSDGRRIVDQTHESASEEEEKEIIRLHPDFRMIALANRPGFPFHGNDFFREIGDVFACHAIDNPDAASEIHLMREYGPSIPMDVLQKLVAAFDELRNLSDEGKLAYPYSTRELAAVVKHMERFSGDGIDRILRNVFDFDNYSPDERQTLIQIFAKHGIPFAMGNDAFQVKTSLNRKFDNPKLVESWTYQSMTLNDPSIRKHPIKTHTMESISRFNHGNGNAIWKLRDPKETGTLSQESRNGQVFSEERYTFKLPRCSVVGCLNMNQSNELVVMGRTGSFTMFLVDAKHENYLSYDLFAALPSDGTFRTAPKSCVITEVLPGVVFITHEEQGYAMVVNLRKKEMLFLEKIPGVIPGAGLLRTALGSVSSTVLIYHEKEDFIGILDFAKNQFHEMKCHVMIEQIYCVAPNKWILVEHGTSHAYELVVVLENGQFTLERFEKRNAMKDFEKVTVSAHKLTHLNHQPLRESTVGNIRTGVRPVTWGTGNVGFITNIPTPTRNDQAYLYLVDDQENTEKVQSVVKDVHSLYLEQSELFITSKERVDSYQVELNIYDYSTLKFRTININLEQDKLTEKPPSALKNVVFDGKKPLTSLNPDDLGVFSLARQAMGDAKRSLFLLEHPDGQSIITIDCLGRARVYYVTELAIRKAFNDWRKVVGVADEDDQLKLMYALSEKEDSSS